MTTTPPRTRSRKAAVVASPAARIEKAGTFTPPDREPRPRRGRMGWVKVIEKLDPVTQHQDIHRITAGYEFPWDYQRSLEFALFRTYCVPTISALLARTGEFEKRPQKRYDDTALLMAELVEHGYDAERGRESLRNINRMHGKYSIDTFSHAKAVLSKPTKPDTLALIYPPFTDLRDLIVRTVVARTGRSRR